LNDAGSIGEACGIFRFIRIDSFPLNPAMIVDISSVNSEQTIISVAELAREIWTQHFTPIIGEPQVEYMLNRFQSVEAISSQLKDGFGYFLARVKNVPVGYGAVMPELNKKRMLLSKLYVKASARGGGVGRKLVDFIEEKCKSQDVNTIRLTVNRFNSDSIAWYKRRGFVVVEEAKKDIGGGFYMDDFIMEKSLNR